MTFDALAAPRVAGGPVGPVAPGRRDVPNHRTQPEAPVVARADVA